MNDLTTMPCSLCNAIESRNDKHQPWCPKSGNPAQPDTFEFQQSIKAALPPETTTVRSGVFVRYLNGQPKAVHIGRTPVDAPRGEYRKLPEYYPAWVAANCVNEVMILARATHPNEPYRSVSAEASLEHMFEHVHLLALGDTSEPHLKHIITRAAMALDRIEAELLGEV